MADSFLVSYNPNVMTFKQASWILLGIGFIPLLGMDYAGKSGRFPSPHGGFEVAFEPPPTQVHLDPDQPQQGPGSKSIRYQVAFYEPGRDAVVAATDFYDIYDSDPTPLPTLAKAILWSPEEDFVILPKENWPSGSPKKGQKLLSLNKAFVWEYETLSLDDASLVWVDRYRVAGNLKNDCILSVAEFDAQTGKTLPVMEGETAYGYEVVGGSGKTLLMKKVLSSCATPEDTRNFKPECVTLDLDFLRREIAPCPK